MKASPKREQALYVQLAESFRRRIAIKNWQIGSRLPNVEDLADEYGVARITVRQAMDILDHEGLVKVGSGGSGIFYGASLLVVMHAFASGGAAVTGVDLGA